MGQESGSLKIVEAFFNKLSVTPFALPIAIGVTAILLLAIILFFLRRSKHKVIEADLQAVEKELRVNAEAQPKSPKLSEEPKESWAQKLKQRLSKTNNAMFGGFASLFQKEKLDSETLDTMYEQLYRADVGVNVADRLIAAVRTKVKSTEKPDWPTIENTLKKEIESIFAECPAPAIAKPAEGPRVILIVGVNGAGKTTSIGKLTANFKESGDQVLLAAADTFRAAAIDQLKEWGNRLDVQVIAQQSGADPAAVAYDGIKAAIARSIDTLIVDTAGRLHNKKDLMEELAKIRRVLAKDIPNAPHETWLVVDGTTGQNANLQVKAFKEVTPLTGIIVTKLDGTAKGGALISIAGDQKIPIRFIGVGEKAEDLKPFKPSEYIDAIFQ